MEGHGGFQPSLDQAKQKKKKKIPCNGAESYEFYWYIFFYSFLERDKDDFARLHHAQAKWTAQFTLWKMMGKYDLY